MVGTCSAMLCLAEVALRLSGLTVDVDPATAVIHRRSSDRELIYDLVAGAETERDGVIIRINPQGFRDDPFPPPRNGGELRVVVLGDSVAAGLGVAMADAFPQQLELLLRAEPPPGFEHVTVLNLGVFGYSTHQEIRLLEKRGMALGPDLVILAYHLNDPAVVDAGQARYFQRSRLALVDLVREALRRIPLYFVGREYHARIHKYYASETEANFERLGAISNRSRVPILVAVIPVFNWQTTYPWVDIHERLGELAAANGLAFVDLQLAFVDSTVEQVARDEWHPNAKGHRLIAEALAALLRDTVADLDRG